MSRHRLVKNLDLDDELDEFDGGENSQDEYDANQDPQMREALTEARAFLGDSFQDKEIQDSLWYYYYDVEKTVNYLTAKQEKAIQSKISKTTGSSKGLQNDRLSSQPQRCSAKDYFWDCPWSNVPLERRAEILVEPLFPPGGLLGGSTQNNPKKSKLAALAAAKKQKNQAAPGQSANSALSLLDSLTSSGDKGSVAVSEKDKAPRSRRYPGIQNETKPQPALELEVQEELSTPIPKKQSQELEPDVSVSLPSSFATTMLGLGSGPQPTLPATSIPYSVFNLTSSDVQANIDPFSGPSPDDIVAKAQSASKGMKGKTQPKGNGQVSKDVKTVSEDLSRTTITESKPPASKHLDVVQEYKKSTTKNASNFVVIGHVDAGKSTLMGRLLYDLKVVDQRTIEKYQREAAKIGKSSFAMAWVLDQGSEEREHGVTIDIAMNKFETEKSAFTILDAPGHKDFVPNMIAGAAQADFAILVIDSSTGSYESGLKGQTKEHALLVRSMGVQRLIVAVNKLDVADWSESRYNEIAQQMEAFLTTAAGFQRSNISFVPCSGLKGDNIARQSTECKWYTGPTLLTLLETAEPTSQERALNGPLRLPISQVFSSSTQFPLSIAGRITSGSVQVADSIAIIPGNQHGYVKGIAVDDEPSDWAVAGQNTTIHLSADIDAKLVKGGDILCSASAPIPLSQTFVVKVLAFEHVMPMFCSMVIGRLDAPAQITKLLAVLDKSTGKPASGRDRKPRVVKPNQAARVEISVEAEGGIPVEEGARVVLRSEGETIATGIVETAK